MDCPDKPGKFQVGGAMIAAKTAAPILPVAHNAGVFWPKRGFIKHPGVIQLRIGEPIDPTGLKTREINRRVETWVKETLEELPESPGSS